MKKPVTSRKLFARASTILPGGVDSPVRAFQAVGGTPLFISRASGARIRDVDGNTYIDYVMSWGPLLHGHAPRGLVRAISAAALERVRFVSSGTEAAMSAIRVARAFTNRSRIIKFAGCYHGHADAFLVKAGSGALTLGIPTSPGVTPAVAADTLIASYNDLASVDSLIREHGTSIAAVIVEPIAGNIGVVPPAAGFLAGLRERCTANGTLLIFDEVFNVSPDLTCLGKIIGGGLPVGAYGGRAEVMSLVAPAGPVYQAGTLSGNPVAMTAGLWALERLKPRLYKDLARRGAILAAGLADAAREAGVPLQVNAFGSLLTPFFTNAAVRDYESAVRSNTAAYATFFNAMLARGIYPPPSQFEAWFLSAAHTDRDIAKTIAAARSSMKDVRKVARG